MSFPRFLRPGPRLALAAAFALLAPAAAGAENKLVWQTNYYAIKGTNLSELRQSIAESRPWKDRTNFVGLTQWWIGWQFKVERSDEGCRCSSFTTTTLITNTLPLWKPPAGAPDELNKTWARYIVALGQHEEGHSRLALAALADMHKRVKALGESPDCATMRKRINETGERVLQEHRQREAEYDRRTNHGATQGAALR